MASRPGTCTSFLAQMVERVDPQSECKEKVDLKVDVIVMSPVHQGESGLQEGL